MGSVNHWILPAVGQLGLDTPEGNEGEHVQIEDKEGKLMYEERDYRNKNSSFATIRSENQEDEKILAEREKFTDGLNMEKLLQSEKAILRSLSRQYIAIAIGCFLLLSLCQGVSLVLLIFSSAAPVYFATLLMFIFVVVYWKYIWTKLEIPFQKLWTMPYPYAAVGAILGSLSQHTILLEEKNMNFASLTISFALVESFYIILVSAKYQEFMDKWRKKMKFRRLCYSAFLS